MQRYERKCKKIQNSVQINLKSHTTLCTLKKKKIRFADWKIRAVATKEIMEKKEKSSDDGHTGSNSKTKKRSSSSSSNKGLKVGDYSIEGLSIAGHETCVILPSLSLAFDIGKCPQRAVSQQFLFISHAHMDHIVISSPFYL